MLRPRGADSFSRARRAYSAAGLIVFCAVALIQGGSWALQLLTPKTAFWTEHPDLRLLYMQLPVPVVLLGAAALFRPKDGSLKGGSVPPPGVFFRLLMALLPIMYGGSILGNLLAQLLRGGMAVNRVAELGGHMTVPVILYTVVLGPIAEELFFRGTLLPRLRRYGDRTAVFFTALLFAVYHMNVFQLFYAFGIGLALGYVFVRTGGVKTGILLHMCLNFLGGVVSSLVLSSGSLMGAAVYLMCLLAATGFGIAALARLKRKIVFAPSPEELPRDIALRAAFGNFGAALAFALCGGLALWSLMSGR